jgi:4-amino-4-deoxy-L-arabinose transferase-like glycosyltransferase
MTLGTAGLVLVYVALVAGLLVLLYDARWRWWKKALLIAVATAFYLVPYVSWPRLQGWPTVDELPERFDVLGMYVQPPNRITGSEGAIFLWAAERRDGGGTGTPRAYRFGYSVKRHDQALAVGEKLRKGIAQAGRKKSGERQGPPGRFDFLGRFGQKSTELEFFDAPAPQLPDK